MTLHRLTDLKDVPLDSPREIDDCEFISRLPFEKAPFTSSFASSHLPIANRKVVFLFQWQYERSLPEWLISLVTSTNAWKEVSPDAYNNETSSCSTEGHQDRGGSDRLCGRSDSNWRRAQWIPHRGGFRGSARSPIQATWNSSSTGSAFSCKMSWSNPLMAGFWMFARPLREWNLFSASCLER